MGELSHEEQVERLKIDMRVLKKENRVLRADNAKLRKFSRRVLSGQPLVKQAD